MSKIRRPNFIVALLIVLALSTVLFVLARSKVRSYQGSSPTVPRNGFLPSQGKSERKGNKPRNLALQRDAFKFSRLLGRRLVAEKREKSILHGVLSIGEERKNVQTVRQQTDDGERVEIHIAGWPKAVSWEGDSGALSSEARLSASERDLIERLVFDSPDQFVLAQLRGASYFTVARNVRSSEDPNATGGPLWNVIRVDDPQDETKRPLSRWRLYYFNVATGLIDRIVSEVQGQRITALLAWTNVQGEKVPSQITWTRDGQTLMQYQLTNFSHADTKGAK